MSTQAMRQALEALTALLNRDMRNTCQHESTHRGGAIWEICDDCGATWADDLGGKPKWRDPKEWGDAESAITALRTALDAEAQPVAPLNGIKATMFHDEGAYAQCGSCGRYSLNPETLHPKIAVMCECGDARGWSGSFKRPDSDAKWSGATPQAAPATAPATARWYCVSRIGMATLCLNEDDAKRTAATEDDLHSLNGPHRAAQMVEAASQPAPAPVVPQPAAQQGDAVARIDPMQDPMRPAYLMNYSEDETPAEMVLRKLACWLGVGGYNAPTVDADLFHRKIIDGVQSLLGAAAPPARQAVAQDDDLPPAYMLAKLAMVMPVMQEARDALCALTEAQRKLHRIAPDLADRMDAAGTFSVDDWRAHGIAPAGEPK